GGSSIGGLLLGSTSTRGTWSTSLRRSCTEGGSYADVANGSWRSSGGVDPGCSARVDGAGGGTERGRDHQRHSARRPGRRASGRQPDAAQRGQRSHPDGGYRVERHLPPARAPAGALRDVGGAAG